jgi:hypothetical protein
MIAGISLVVLGGVGFAVWQTNKSHESDTVAGVTQSADSSTGKPDSTPAAAPNIPAATPQSTTPRSTTPIDDVGPELDRLSRRAESATDMAGNQLILTQIRGLASKLKTPDQRVRAAIIESMAQIVVDSTKRCTPLRKVEGDLPNAASTTVSEFSTLFDGCKAPQ